jgi:spore coat protein CotF
MPEKGQSVPDASAIQNKSIAMELLRDSKFWIVSLTRAASEAGNPRFRQFINEALAEAVQEHFDLADTLAGKGWRYPPEIGQDFQADLVTDRQVSQVKLPASADRRGC